MRELGQVAAPMADEVGGFNVFDAMLGVLADPGATMRQINVARPWLFSLVLAGGITTITWIARLTPDLAAPRDPVVPYEYQALYAELLAFIRSPFVIAFFAFIVTPVSLLISTAITYAVGTIFGRGTTYTGLLATQVFALVPSILEAILLGAMAGMGAAEARTAGSVTSIFGLWTLSLQIIGIRESFRTSTLTAIIIYLAPIVVLAMGLFGLMMYVLGQAISAPTPPGFAPVGRSL